MNKYLELIKISFQNISEYRFNFLLGIVSNGIGNIVLYLFWASLLAAGYDAKPYTKESLIYYYLLISIITAMISFDSNIIAEDIRDGYITYYVTKPISYLVSQLVITIPDKCIQLTVGIAIFLVILFFGFTIPLQYEKLIPFFAALILGMTGNYLLFFTIGLLAFWTQRVFGFATLITVASALVAGRYIPIDLLPPFFFNLSYFLPFRYFLFFPIQIMLQTMDLTALSLNFAVEIAWLMIFYFLSQYVWEKGMRRLEAVGL